MLCVVCCVLFGAALCDSCFVFLLCVWVVCVSCVGVRCSLCVASCVLVCVLCCVLCCVVSL